MVSSLAVEHGLKVHGGFSPCSTEPGQLLCVGSQSAGSVVLVHGLSCSVACGIFPDRGSNLCPLH